MQNSPTDPLARELLLRGHSEKLGATWATDWFKRLRDEGRPVRGGWPGTLQEAKYHARMHCDRELGQLGMPPLNQTELIAVATSTYERAKHDWLQVARERDRCAMRKR